MAKQTSADKYIQNVPKTFGKGVAKTDATKVTKKLKPTNARLVTQEQLDQREATERRARINAANAMMPNAWESPENFAASTNATGDKLRVSDYPNFFDDYVNPASMFGHLASGLGQIPLNIKEGNYGQAAMNLAAPAVAGAAEAIAGPLISKGLSAGKKAAKSAIDKNFTQVGKQLAQIEKEGIAKGLSPHEIKMQQMDQVGITSAQREGYVPGISDLAYKYVYPFGYSSFDGSKFKNILKQIQQGGIKYFGTGESGTLEPREDAWRMYLGMPQRHGTFEMAQTAPIQHVAYTPEQLSNLELFSIKSKIGKDIEFPSASRYGDKMFDFNFLNDWERGMDYLNKSTVVADGHVIMGGHNKRLSRAGLEYNDVWDLEPSITPYNFLPQRLKSTFDENPLFFNKNYVNQYLTIHSPKQFTIPVDKFLGKPFMSHGVEQGITSTGLVDNMRKSALREINYRVPIRYEQNLSAFNNIDDATAEDLGVNFRSAIDVYRNSLNTTKEKLKELESYPKFEEGGWLEKYNDGGPVQENYNDYSVTVPPNYKGEGYFNEGRDYSPAWGGQFKEGGPVKRFMQPTETFKNIGYNPKENGLSTEYSTSIGGPGEVYLVPGYRQGRLLNDPEATFNMYGEHLGGPFKTVKAAEDFAQLRHKYVEQNKNIPAPFKTRDYAMGGSVNMPTIKDKGSFNSDGVWIPDWKAMAAQAKKLGAKKVKTDRGGVINFNDKWEAVSADDSNNMAMGGSIGGATQGIPGATGFMYARTGSTPSKGKGSDKVDKTVASAQVGIELIKGEETQPVKTPAIKSEERIKAQEKVIDTAPVDIIEEGRSKFRFNMLQDAVKHDMAMEQGIALDDVNNKELKNRTKELLAKREAKLANPRVEFVKGNGTVNDLAGGEYILGYYNPENKNALVSLSDNLDQLDVDKFQSTTRHEFRHAYDDGGKYLTNYEKELIGRKTNTDNVEKQKAIGIDRYEYLKDPTEVTARLQDIRGALKDNPRTTGYLKKKKDDLFTLDNKVDKEGYYLDDITKERMPIQKTYDAKKDKATYEDLYYLNEKTKNSGLQDLLKVMKADDIVELLNTIAANNPQQGMPMAQKGKQIKPYANSKKTINELEADLTESLNLDQAIDSAENYIIENNIANNWGLHNGPLDAVRHAASSAQTSSQLANIVPGMKYNPGVMLGSILATNALGLGHELSSPNEFSERASDLYNNLAGSIIGVLPGDNNKRNERINSALNSGILSNMKGKNSGDKPFDPRVKTTIDNSKNKPKSFIKKHGPLSNESLDAVDIMGMSILGNGFQNGGEMKYYQEGLDWKPKSISKNGKKIIKDDMGQWDHPGEITEIGSNQITMQGVPYPVLGISDTGDMQMMYPDEEYQYDGESVTEYPMMKQGGQLTKLDQLTNFTNYNTKQPGGWLDKYQ